MISDTN